LLYYGIQPLAIKIGPEADVRWSAQFGFPKRVQSYRMFKQRWIGRPETIPDVVVEAGSGYICWNGATEVSAWVDFEGRDKGSLRRTRRVRRTGV